MTLPMIMLAWYVLSVPVVRWADRDREPVPGPRSR